MLAFLSRSPVENLMLLSLHNVSKKRFYADEKALDLGVMGVSGRVPPVDPLVVFSAGEPSFQVDLIRHLPAGPYVWDIPSTGLYEALTKKVRFSSISSDVAYSRTSGGPLSSGTARLLTNDDIPCLIDERPLSANVIMVDKGARVFGVIEDGRWVADAWVVPLFGRFWSIADLRVKPEHRGRGHGKAVTAACVNYLLETGQVPVYETEEENAPARNLAERLGFTIQAKRMIGEGILSQTRNGLSLAQRS